jgi:peptidoglycan hydrolase-like protein with peptidoglycan-binding domain
LRRRRLTVGFPPEETLQGAEYIRWVQASLNRVLALRLPVNGILGPETRSAVRRFQERERLPVTGIVGPDTERALIAALAGIAPAGPAEPEPSEGAALARVAPAGPAEPEPSEGELADLEFAGNAGEWGEEVADFLQEENRAPRRCRAAEISRIFGVPEGTGRNAGYESSLESELADLEAEAASAIPRGRCTPVGRRVGNFTCSNAERAQIRAFLGRPTVTVPALRAAVEAAGGRAVSLATRAANALDRSRRNDKTRRVFCEAFGVPPEFVPPWRATLHGVVRWRDLGELVAIRLRDVAKILDGGCIRYFCWGSPAHCPECTASPTSYFACSSFLGRYIICLGGLFWRAWQSGDTVTTASTLLHEALHIYFSRTVSDSGRSGNANCYERFAVRLQNLFLHPATAANCTAGSCASSTPARRRHKTS